MDITIYEAVIDAIEKRTNRNGECYVEDYGSSIHKTAHASKDETLEAIYNMEDLGWLVSQKSPAGFPVKVKFLKKPTECKEYVAMIKKEITDVLEQASASYEEEYTYSI